MSNSGEEFLTGFGLTALLRQRPIRYCVDWSEQRHHLAGALGRDLLRRLTEAEWIRRAEATRAVRVTPTGRQGLRDAFGIRLDQP